MLSYKAVTADFAWKGLGLEGATAFDESLESLRPGATATALRIVGERTLAEDVVQDAFVKATLAAAQLRDGQSLAAWLRKIVVRCALDALADRRSSDSNLDRAMVAPVDKGLGVQMTLDRLKPDHQAVLALAFGDGLTHQEIADALDIPMGTVASRIHAAKAAFRKVWEDDHD